MYNQSGIENFLKSYYYNKLTELYRETPLDDSYYPITVNSSGKKPMQVYPKLPEYLNGRAGSFIGLSTLASSWKNEGSGYSNLKLTFQKMTVSEDKKKKTISFTFYITKDHFVSSFGYDMSTYYVRQTIRELPQTQADAIWSTALELFKKEFTNTRPRFLFKSSKLYDDMQKLSPGKITLTDWQRFRSRFEKDYTSAAFKAVDADEKDVVNDYGYAVTKGGARIEDADEARARLAETAYILVTITDDYVYPALGLEHSLFVSDEEKDNVSGYLTVKKLTQTLKDNYVSKSYSNSWLETDLENQPTEYVSFGDDRNVSVRVTNRLLENEADYEQMRLTAKKERTHDSEVITLDKYGRILTGSGYSQFVKTSTPEDQGLRPVYKKTPENPVILDSEGTRSLKWSADGKTYFISDDIDVYYSPEGDIVLSVPPSRAHTGDITNITLMYKVIFVLVRRTFLYFTGIISASLRSGYRTSGAVSARGRFSRPQTRLLAIILKILRNARARFLLKILCSGYRTSGQAKAYQTLIRKAEKTRGGFRLLGVPAKAYVAWIQKARRIWSGYRTSGIAKTYRAAIGKARRIWSGYRSSGIAKTYRAAIGKARRIWSGYKASGRDILIKLLKSLGTVYTGGLASVPKTDHVLALWLEHSEFRNAHRPEALPFGVDAAAESVLYILFKISGKTKEHKAAVSKTPARGGFRPEAQDWSIAADSADKQIDIYKNGVLAG